MSARDDETATERDAIPLFSEEIAPRPEPVRGDVADLASSDAEIGKYEIVAELGAGGMAMVYLARATGPHGFQRWFAIKRVHPHLERDQAFVHMFLDEARIAAALHHRNVAQVWELGTDGGSHYLVMEYLHGEHLASVARRWTAERGPIPFAVAAHVVACAAEGLHHAHEARDKDGALLHLVHRDVSPHNIFVGYDGDVKITDFGIAKAAGRLTHTQTGGLKGKISYMAPEQVARAEVDRRADIFALGIVLWEITTGKRLFKADTEVQTIMRITSGRIPRPSTVRADYPAELERIVLRALARRPDDRYATAGELASDLAALCTALAEGASAERELARGMQELFANERADKERLQRSPPRSRSKETLSPEAATPVTRARAGRRGAGAWIVGALVVLVALGATAATLGVVVGREGSATGEASGAFGSEPGSGASSGSGSGSGSASAGDARPAATPMETPPRALGTDPEREQTSEAPRPAIVRVDTEPPGAEVTIDGETRGASPVLVEALAPGNHVIELALEGFEDERAEVALAAGRSDLRYALRPAPPARSLSATHGTGTLNIVTVPWAEAWVNGEHVGTTPIVDKTVRAGVVVLRLRAEGTGPERTVRIRVRPNETVRRRVSL